MGKTDGTGLKANVFVFVERLKAATRYVAGYNSGAKAPKNRANKYKRQTAEYDGEDPPTELEFRSQDDTSAEGERKLRRR